MKKIRKCMSLLLVASLVFTLSGCGNRTDNSYTERNESEESRLLIAYFSWADNAEDFNPDDIDADVLGHASVVAPGDVGVIAQYIEERTQADFRERSGI